MQVQDDHLETPSAIRTDLGAIFVSLELSRSTWLVTSLSPGNGEKLSKHSLSAGDVAALLMRFSELRQKAMKRTAKSFPIVVIQEAGFDGFSIHRVLQNEGIESHVVDPASIATARGAGERRPTVLTARRWFARCWLISVANRECARWSKRQRPSKKTADGCVVSAKC